MRTAFVALSALVVACTVVACGGGTNQSDTQAPAGTPSPQPVAAASADKNAYPVFVNPDERADPAVTAEQGGKGFTGAGWETNTSSTSSAIRAQ